MAALAMRLHQHAIGDDVRAHALRLHVLKDARQPVPTAAARAGVDDRFLGHCGKLDAQLHHLLEDHEDSFETLCAREAFEPGAADDGVSRLRAFLVVAELVGELIGALGVPVADDRLDHASERDAGGPDVPAPHLLPAAPQAMEVLGSAQALMRLPKVCEPLMVMLGFPWSCLSLETRRSCLLKRMQASTTEEIRPSPRGSSIAALISIV